MSGATLVRFVTCRHCGARFCLDVLAPDPPYCPACLKR